MGKYERRYLIVNAKHEFRLTKKRPALLVDETAFCLNVTFPDKPFIATIDLEVPLTVITVGGVEMVPLSTVRHADAVTSEGDTHD